MGLDLRYKGISRSDLREGNVKKPVRTSRSSRKSDMGESGSDALDSSGVLYQLPERRQRSNSGHSSMSQGHTLKRVNMERNSTNLLLPDAPLPQPQRHSEQVLEPEPLEEVNEETLKQFAQEIIAYANNHELRMGDVERLVRRLIRSEEENQRRPPCPHCKLHQSVGGVQSESDQRDQPDRSSTVSMSSSSSSRRETPQRERDSDTSRSTTILRAERR